MGRLAVVTILPYLAAVAFAENQTFTVYSGESRSFVVPRNGPKVVADYVVEKGTGSAPAFYYSDTSNCENKYPADTSGTPWYYSINLQNDETGSEIGTDSGTNGPALTVYDCGCPYQSPYDCPPAQEPWNVDYFQRRKIFDVSDWTDDGDVPMTIRAQGVAIDVTVYEGKPDQGLFAAEPSLAPQIKDIDPSPALLRRGPVTLDADPVPNQTLTVPLGLPFKWGMLKRKDKSPVKATYELLVHHFDPLIPDDTAKFPGRPTVLFDDRVLLAFGADEPVPERWFIGLHLGKQFFKVTPVDPKIPACIVRVDVKLPEQLGKPPNDLDDWLAKTAHRRGIPPHWIKAQVEKESVKKKVAGQWIWRRDTFRYEPFSADKKWISRNKKLRSKEPYDRYRLSTQANDDDLPQGADLNRPADTEFRNRYKYKRGNAAPAQITEDVVDVTASEIVLANEAAGKKGENYDIQNSDAFNAWVAAFGNGQDPLLFNAQTTLASSYGLVQMLYVSAIELNWNNATGDPDAAVLNPALLMDTDDNLNGGDGSLHIGTVLLLKRRNFASNGGNAKCVVPTFDLTKYNAYKEFEDAHRSLLTTYNCGFSKDGLTYGEYVMSGAKQYTPTRKDTGIQ